MADREKKGAEEKDSKKKEKPEKKKKEKPEKEDKKEKKEKKEKPEKPDKKKKSKKEPKEPKEHKPHPVRNTLFITCMIWVLLLLVFSFMTFINAFELKEIVLQMLNPEDTYEAVFWSDIQSALEWETELENRAKELDERETWLSDRESELDEFETELYDLQSEMEEKYPEISEDGAQLPGTSNDIKNIASSVAAMEPAKAAQALIETPEDIAVAVLRVMKKADRGTILSQMSSEDAARFIEAMAGPLE